MVGVPPARDDDENRLTGARGEFVASRPRRLELLRAGLVALGEAPADRERLNGLLRRLHALGSAARVLGFASVAEVLAEAERTLRKSPKAGPQGVALKEVARALEMLPSLVTGGPMGARAGQEGDAAALAGRASPVSILVFGPSSLADAFRVEVGERFELEHCADAATAMEFARSAGPDAVILDAEAPGSREFVEELRKDPLVEPMAVVVVGSFAGPEAAAVYVAAGADRVLAKPVSPETLRRTLLELGELSAQPRGAREPVGELTVDELAERIAGEVKKGLVDSLELGGQSTRVDFGDGADVLGAVWGAVARVRELVTLRSSGNLRFQPFGPEGAIPLAPWMNDERRAGERGGRHARAAEDVALKGRRIVVADDDPAVVWFLSGLLKAVGAQVLEAHDGERALERVFETWPDLVVSDVLMPRRDGFSLCHEIKRDVAVRDVPVILLSWKEDLLQRVRELGAAADGYLRKEAAASTVVERVREVLRPRARIEQRLRVGGEVRGRLDGVTPRLVLELVSQLCPDATLTIRDAVYLYEAHLRAGRLRSLTRSAADGSFERGPAVLAALLGVSAGRFVVQPDSTPCRAEFDAALLELFEEPVRRARSALAALAAERLPRVVRVELDLAPVGRYLDCTPHTARRLVQRLAAGEAPRDLLMSGEASAWLLEAVLSDMARRGAVLAVEREPGAPEIPEKAPEAGAEAPDEAANTVAGGGDFGAVESAWSEPAPPPTGSAPSNTRVSADAVSDAQAVVAPVVLAGSLSTGAALAAPVQAQSVPLEREAQPASQAAATSGDEGWFSFQLDSTASGSASASREVTAVAPVPSSEEADSVFAALAEETADEPVPRAAPPRRDMTPAGLGPPPAGPASSAEPRSETPHRVGVRPVLRMPPPSSERASPSMADVFAAALADEPGPNSEVTVRAVVQSAAQVPTDPAPVDPASLAKADASSEPAPVAPAPQGEPEAESSAAPTVQEATPGPVLPEASLVPAQSEPAEPPRAATPSGEAALDPRAALDPPRRDRSLTATLISASPPEMDALATAASSTADPPATAPDPFPSVPPPESAAPPAAEPARDAQLTATLASAADPAPLSPPRPQAPKAPRPPTKPKGQEPETTAPPASVARAPGRSTAAGTSTEEAGAAPDGVARTLGLAIVAFGAAFVFFRWVVVPALAPSDPVEATPAPSAIVAAARGSAAPAVAGPAMKVQNLALPDAFDPGPGRGLLEVVTAPADSIYVDGTFVGKGPGRSIPAAAGRHEVKIVRADAEHTTFVELTAGRRIRLGLELEAGAAPRP